MSEIAWLDVTIMRCPNCGKYYAESSWYAIEMHSDTECGKCGHTFNTRKSAVDRILLEFELDSGKVKNVRVNMHLSLKDNR